MNDMNRKIYRNLRKDARFAIPLVILLLFTLRCGAALNSRVYDIRSVRQTNPDIQLKMGDTVILNYPQISQDLIGKFNIGEFSVIDFTDLLIQEFTQQLGSRGVILKEYDYAGTGAKMVSIAITDFDDQGVPGYDLSLDQNTTRQWENREINNGRVGYYPECYFLGGTITLQAGLGQKVFRVEKTGSNFSYARSTDLIENLRMFVTTACNELFLNK